MAGGNEEARVSDLVAAATKVASGGHHRGCMALVSLKLDAGCSCGHADLVEALVRCRLRGMDDQRREALARTGYEAYGAHADWKAYNGQPMPRWDELRPDIKEKWGVAAEAIVNAAAPSFVPGG